jgi:2-dehydropantoate 2-reductase
VSRPVVIVGAGALGTLLAAHFAGRGPVSIVARGATARALRRRRRVRLLGIAAGSYPVELATPASLRAAALVLVTVKAYDLEAVLRQLGPRLAPRQRVVVLQNGLGIRSAAERVLGREVIRGVTFLAAAGLGPGQAAFHAVGKTYFPAASEEVMRAWRDTGLPAVVVPDLLTYVWRKLAINAVINPLSALLAVPNGALAPLRHTTRQIVDEVVQVARCTGQPLEAHATLAKVRASMRQTAANPSSMLQDVRGGRPTEIDWINGAIVRLADRHGVAVPVNRGLVELVRFVEQRARHAASPRSRRAASFSS